MAKTGSNMMRIFVTGGTGLIGTRLIRRLRERGDHAVLLTRRPQVAGGVGAEVIAGNPADAGAWGDAAAGCDAIINLAGENLFGRRWNAEFKKLMRESRLRATTNCAAALAKAPRRADAAPKVLINGSAVGYYGPHGAEELDESSPPGDDFLAKLCVDWENATQPASDAGVRVVLARTGMALDKEGGALKKLLTPFKLGAGGPVASGKQYMSWVHHQDVVEMLLFALDNSRARGPMNVTAPNPCTNKEFGKALGSALGRPAFMWTPGTMLKLMLGESAHIVTTGQRVLPRRALQWGYTFRFPKLDAALADVLK